MTPVRARALGVDALRSAGAVRRVPACDGDPASVRLLRGGTAKPGRAPKAAALTAAGPA